MIELKHISRTFEQNGQLCHAVRDVSLTIHDGEIFGIIGFSGAGKSTLVRCINLLERPDCGQVCIDGLDLTTLKPKALRLARQRIGMIFQHFNLLPSRDVAANIAYPLRTLSRQERQARVAELLDLVGMSDKAHYYPSQLSGGQKQRVAIARALASKPEVLLCDEATSALDPESTHSILQLLKELNRKLGLTLVLITHQMEAVREICTQVAVMQQGVVVEQGDVFSLFAEPKEPVTQRFIQATSSIYRIPQKIKDGTVTLQLQPGERLVRFSYRKKHVSEALVSEISRRFALNINILCGQIEIVQEAPIGGLVSIISGAEENYQDAVKYLQQKEVRVEELSHVAA